MLNAQEELKPRSEKLPIGDFYRTQIDSKYHFVVKLKPSLTDSIAFCEALKKDEQWSLHQRTRQQLHFGVKENNGTVSELEVETGNWQTLSQLLFASPAIVAQKGFVDQLVTTLMDYATKLHAEGVYHLCFSPDSIFVRKGDTSPLLLTHGSFYTSLSDQNDLYAGSEDFVAPEVFSHGTIDERSDVYSLGKLIIHLYGQSALPFEYKKVVKKATAQDPSQRFKSVEEMKDALTQRRSTMRSVYALVGTVVIALFCFYLYTELMPSAERIEFVEPAQQKASADPFDTTFDPESLEDDTLMQSEMDAIYQKKAEEILRRREEREAEALKLQEQAQKRQMRAKGVVEPEESNDKSNDNTNE